MKKELAVGRRFNCSPAPSSSFGHFKLWSILLLVSLSGCQWVFGDYEVVDQNNQPSLSKPCDVKGQYYCEANVLYLCADAGTPWTELLDCKALTCDAVVGRCLNPETTGDATTANTNTGAGGTVAQ